MDEDLGNMPVKTRREILQIGATLAAGTVAMGCASAQEPPPSQGSASPLPPEGQSRSLMGALGGQLFWTVKTEHGSVQGISNGNGRIKQFKGIPYGAPTGGRNRFMPPKPPVQWTGVRECFGYGQVSPQIPMHLGFDYAIMLYWDTHVGPGGMGDDCLNLNLWTPSVNDAVRRPVMVCLHGGGWSTGSGNGPMYDGAQLANFGDVVVVTVNHRLAASGYLHLDDLGAPPEFAHAGVCGVMDMVAALRWVRNNIEQFGGDPSNVTIFGQSGGGMKVTTLMSAPSAKGLFHRAIVQSGPALRQQSREAATRSAEAMLKTLGVSKGTSVKAIQDASWQDLLEAQTRSGGDFRPIVDGEILPHHPFDPVASPHSAEVPMIIGTTLHDYSNAFQNFDVDDAELLKIFRKSWGDRAESILAAYRRESPSEPAFLIQSKAYTDAPRGDTILQAERKAAQGGAAAYLYVWDWATPAYDGRYGALHASDLDASLLLYRSPVAGAGSADGRLMADRLASTFVSFARTGVPDNAMVPAWPAYNATRRATMVFDRDMRVTDDYRGEFVGLIGETGPSTVRR